MKKDEIIEAALLFVFIIILMVASMFMYDVLGYFNIGADGS